LDNFSHLGTVERDTCLRLRDQAAYELKREQLFLLIRTPATVSLAVQAGEEMVAACSKVPAMAYRACSALLTAAMVAARSPSARHMSVAYAWRALTVAQLVAAECITLYRRPTDAAVDDPPGPFDGSSVPILACRKRAASSMAMADPEAPSAATGPISPVLQLVRRICRPELPPTADEQRLISTPGTASTLIQLKSPTLAPFSLLCRQQHTSDGVGVKDALLAIKDSVEWASWLLHHAFDALAVGLEVNEAYLAAVEVRKRHLAFAREAFGARHLISIQCEQAAQCKSLKELALVEELVLRRSRDSTVR
jgi:hypothetical protein